MAEESEELVRLRKRFECHLNEYRIDVSEQRERELRQDIMQQNNLEAIQALTKAVQPLVDGITVLVVIQKLVKWLSGFAFAGVIWMMFTDNNPFN